MGDLEEFNPFDGDTENFYIFEQAKIAQFTADVVEKNMAGGDMSGIAYINTLHGQRDGYLEAIDGKSN